MMSHFYGSARKIDWRICLGIDAQLLQGVRAFDAVQSSQCSIKLALHRKPDADGPLGFGIVVCIELMQVAMRSRLL